MKSANIDMINGNMKVNIIRYTLPIMFSGILQLLFNACDMIVVGRFAGSTPLAAVGATATLTNLLVNLFVGLSVGANVLAAQLFGARNYERFDRLIHTSLLVSFLSGIFLAVLGYFICRPCLIMLNTPDDVLDLSVLYMRIIFMGMPMLLLYNFGASILRAEGNTRQPLIFLTIGGIANVFLNLLLVIVFDLSVAGVAIGTVVSQIIAAFLVLMYLRDPSKPYTFSFKKLCIDWGLFKNMIQIGVPAGVHGMMFSIANMQIQSSLNLFGSAAMAGCAAASSIEGFAYTSINSVSQTALNFTGQNVGADRRDQIPKIMHICLLYLIIIAVVLGGLGSLFARPLLSFYTKDAEAIRIGMTRMLILLLTYFTIAPQEIIPGILRGVGYSTLPTLISLVGVCGFRIVWIYTYFQTHKTLMVLYITYPISWILTGAAYIVCYFVLRKKILHGSAIISAPTDTSH